jgi:hypothetical protein
MSDNYTGQDTGAASASAGVESGTDNFTDSAQGSADSSLTQSGPSSDSNGTGLAGQYTLTQSSSSTFTLSDTGADSGSTDSSGAQPANKTASDTLSGDDNGSQSTSYQSSSGGSFGSNGGGSSSFSDSEDMSGTFSDHVTGGDQLANGKTSGSEEAKSQDSGSANRTYQSDVSNTVTLPRGTTSHTSATQEQASESYSGTNDVQFADANGTVSTTSNQSTQQDQGTQTSSLQNDVTTTSSTGSAQSTSDTQTSDQYNIQDQGQNGTEQSTISQSGTMNETDSGSATGTVDGITSSSSSSGGSQENYSYSATSTATATGTTYVSVNFQDQSSEQGQSQSQSSDGSSSSMTSWDVALTTVVGGGSSFTKTMSLTQFASWVKTAPDGTTTSGSVSKSESTQTNNGSPEVTVPGLLQQQDQGMEVRYLKEAFISPNHLWLRDPGAGMGGVPAWSVPGLIGGLMGGMGGGGGAGAGQAAQDAAAAASLCFDFVPGISVVKGLAEAATGIDPVTGQSVGTFGRVCGVLSVIPGGKWLGKGLKWAGGGVAKRFPKIAAGLETVFAKAFRRGSSRSLGELIKDAGANPSKWQVVKKEVVASTNMRNKGGTSVQELLRNTETAEEIVRHTLLKPDGKVFEPSHFRPFWK